MRRKVRKAVSYLLVAAMAVGLGACGSQVEEADGPGGGTATEMQQNDGETIVAGTEEDDEKTDSKEDSSPVEIDENIGGTLTVSVYEADEWLRAAASEFMIQHPEVTVVIHDFKNGTDLDIYSDSGVGDSGSRPTGQTREDYISQLNTQIMSVQAEDLILTSSGIPIERYIQMGVFEDLTPYLQSAGEITEEDYYMNIFDACRAKDGGLYQFPLSVMAVPLMEFNAELMENTGVSIPEDTDRISWREALDLAEEMCDQSTLPNTFMVEPHSIVGNIFTKASMDAMNYQTGKVEFDRERMMTILDTYGELSGYQKLPDDWSWEETAYLPFSISYRQDWEWAVDAVCHPDSYIVKQWEQDDGKVYLCPYYALDFGINAASENKGTAWAFLKFLASEQIQTLPSLPWAGINKAGLRARVDGALSSGGYGDFSEEQKQAILQQLEQWILMINAYRQEDTDLIILTESVLAEFTAGNRSAEETLDDLQYKLEQFMSQ